METLHSFFLSIHVPAGFISIVLFWIPVFTKKGRNKHKKVGIWYYRSMWVVVITAFLLSIVSTVLGNYIQASFLGYLTILTAYPLWYSFEILQQKKEWTDLYFNIRRIFALTLFIASLGMISGAIYLKFLNAGILMAFFGLLGIGSVRDVRMTKAITMNKENRLDMHIQGTIVSGIAAYTAFLAFGGRHFLGDLLPGFLQILPWIFPTVIGLIIIRLQRKKYGFA